jgi:hypothetical protein
MRSGLLKCFSLGTGMLMMLSNFAMAHGNPFPDPRPKTVSVPEIAVAAVVPALAVLAGGILILAGKRKKNDAT